MKNLSLLLLLFVFNKSFGQETPHKFFTIKGTLKNWNGNFIYFSCKGIGDTRIWDSSIVKNNTFKFTGTLEEPSNGFITILKFNRVNNLNDKNITERLFISPSQMTISLELNSFHQAKLNGSKFQDEYQALQKSKELFYKKIESLNKIFDSINEKYITTNKLENNVLEMLGLEHKMDSLQSIINSISAKCSKVDRAFFEKNANSYITSYLLKDYYKRFTLKELKYYYNRMSTITRKWEYGIKLKEAITSLQVGSPGNVATNFSAVDVNGDSISLSQFRGKYVLLDFWASWCKPCRAGNPELIRLYNKYRNEGIEFISIADDKRNQEKWKDAIEKDKINIWRHILDIQIGEAYSVHTIPLQILIDKNGIIIGRFGDGGEPNKNISKTFEKLFYK